MRPGKKASLSLDGKPYRGKLELVPQGGFLRVVNVVALESYLQGVVAGEMPYSWPAEALKSQAVAARSYALASLLKGKPFDLYCGRAQPGLPRRGRREAVDDEGRDRHDRPGRSLRREGRDDVLLLDVGRQDGERGRRLRVRVPYLVSRPDPWDKLSPYNHWGPVLLGARTVQSKLGADARVLDAQGCRDAVGPPPLRDGRHDHGRASRCPRRSSGPLSDLRSTWVTIGVLRLDRPSRGAVVFGSSTRLSGVGRGLGNAEARLVA